MNTILFTEECWASSQLSIVRHTGQVSINGITYIIVDKAGRDIFELSAIAQKEGRTKAIEAGEPCDLVDSRYVKAYRKMGRDAFIEMLKGNPHLTVKMANEIAAQHKKEHKQELPQPGDLFEQKE